MAQYYEEDKLLKYVELFVNGESTIQCVKKAIRYAPTADVAEVKHGAWNLHDRAGFRRKDYIVCSVCDVMIPTYKNNTYCLTYLFYCPRCGAKMDVENGDSFSDNEIWRLNWE
jgi:predicted RNA-binding Zn-ribbon protein involved in translation (DUF1610 family)